MLAREQEGHVDGHPGEDRLLDGGQALLGTGNLDEQVGAARPRVQVPRGGESARGVVRQERRDLQRHPSVHAVRLVPGRAKEVGRPGEVFQGQLEEQRLARLALLDLLADCGVVRRAVLDGMVEDRGVGREPGHGQLVDVALERAGLE